MKPEDFYNLKIGQVIWYNGNGFEIKGLEKQNYDSTELEATIHFYCGYSYRWDKICADCSLEAPKEKKRYWLWYEKTALGYLVPISPYLIDDEGLHPNGESNFGWDIKEKKRKKSNQYSGRSDGRR